MRTFQLRRLEDEGGVSGVGVVAQGAVFDDGTCALHWLGSKISTAIYASLEAVKAIHGHGGKTVVEYTDAERDTRLNFLGRYPVEGGYTFHRVDIPREAIQNVTVNTRQHRPNKFGWEPRTDMVITLHVEGKFLKDSFGRECLAIVTEFSDDPAGELPSAIFAFKDQEDDGYVAWAEANGAD